MRYLIRERFFRFGDDATITDENGNVVLEVDGKVLTLRDRLVLRNPAGQAVAEVHRQEAATVRKHFFTPFRDRFTIDIPGPDDLELSGNLLDHEFTIRRGRQTVATASKRWFSIRDTYAVDIEPGQDDLLILASVLALELADAREERKEQQERSGNTNNE
jgi:uncharacterized protein YxjI